MRVLRTQLVIVFAAISLCSGCRSASVAQRSAVSPAMNSTEPVSSEKPARSEQSPERLAELTGRNQSAIQLTSAERPATVSEPIQQPAGSRLSLQSAIETGLAQNPDLVALRQNEGVGVTALGVAQTYPFNPFVQVQATPYQSNPAGGPGTTYHYVLLMQQIQLGHQQQFREEAACAVLNGIRWNVLQAELLNVAQTERLYFTAIYQQGLRDLANLYAENNRQLLQILEKQKEAGQATGADVAIVRLDAQSTRQQQRVAEANYQTAMLDLKRQLRLPPQAEFTLDPEVTNWIWQPVIQDQVADMATNRPDVMAARADADTARANTNWANGQRIPDLQIGPYYQRTDNGITYLGFRAQMDIPVINDGVPLLRQRQAELFQRATLAQQLAIRATLEAQAAANRYERARQIRLESTDVNDSSVPVELQKLEEQFRENEVDILRVIQARSSLLQKQRADLDALNELMQAAATLTAASGASLESLAVSVGSPPVQAIVE